MEDQKVNPPSTAPDNPPAAQTPDFKQLASQLAAKHAANKTAAQKPDQPAVKPRNKGGRRTTQEEVADFLARHNLRAVPAGAGPDPGSPAPQPAQGYIVTYDFVHNCAETLLKGVEAYRQRQVFLRTLALSGDKNLARDLANEAGAPPGAIEVMSLSAAELAQKYSLVATWTPEAMLIIAGLTWLTKDVALQKRLREIAAMKTQAEKPTTTPETPKQ